MTGPAARGSKVRHLYAPGALRGIGERTLVATCDWGHCDNLAVLERYSPRHGWLPVCDHHSRTSLREKGKPGRRDPEPDSA